MLSNLRGFFSFLEKHSCKNENGRNSTVIPPIFRWFTWIFYYSLDTISVRRSISSNNTQYTSKKHILNFAHGIPIKIKWEKFSNLFSLFVLSLQFSSSFVISSSFFRIFFVFFSLSLPFLPLVFKVHPSSLFTDHLRYFMNNFLQCSCTHILLSLPNDLLYAFCTHNYRRTFDIVFWFICFFLLLQL